MHLALLLAPLLICGSSLAQSPGRLLVWGTGPQPELATPDSVVFVSSGVIQNHCILTDGSIYRWGQQVYGTLPSPNSGFTAVSSLYSHSLALRANGSVVGWGENLLGETGSPSPNSGFIEVSAGPHFSLALRSSGTVVAWGLNMQGDCNVPAPNSGFTAISAGYYFGLGLKQDGSVVGWGANGSGQLDVPEPNTDFVAIGAGSDHGLGLKADGSLVAWGSNQYGQLNLPEPNTGFIAIAAGLYHNLALRADSSLVGWGFNGGGVCEPPTPNGPFLTIAAGGSQSLVTRRLLPGQGVLQSDSLELGALLAGTILHAEFTLENVGQGTLSGTAQPDHPAFTVNSPEFSLEPGESRTFLVRFMPGEPGHATCTVDLGPQSPSLTCLASAYQLSVSTGPDSDCGLVENPGDQPDAEEGFLVDWRDGLIGLEILPAPRSSHGLVTTLHLDGDAVWSGATQPSWAAVSALDTLGVWLQTSLRVHFEVHGRDHTWNQSGNLCAWDLVSTGVSPLGVPGELWLQAPVPNPFNPTTTLEYSLPAEEFVNLTLFNIQGTLVRELVAQTQPAGRHSVIVDGSALASGLYLARLQTAQGVRSTRLLLLK
ncbi:MAG: T9SS type A sorting domain-containing protein [Candidatus Cloacimonetes bacterium]|nr:T9SS type A sorting domain-containing protein [Candidatus Cloacimonadota bacterium]